MDEAEEELAVVNKQLKMTIIPDREEHIHG